MKEIKVYTQEELDKALNETSYPALCGDKKFEVYGSAQVTASGSAQVRAYDSAQVTAYDSAQVRASGSAQVTAYDSAQVRASGSAQVTAYDSAQVRASGSAQVTASGSAQVTAYDSAQVRASGSAQVTAYDSAQVRAGKYVAVTKDVDFKGKITGGVIIIIPSIKTLDDWLEFYGIGKKSDGSVILFKAVDENFKSPHGTSYAPGEMPSAPDWDGGKEECGGGLHFSPTPHHALKFNPDAKKFVACPVAGDNIFVHYPALYPDKVKAPRIFAPCYEVDINGNPVGTSR